MNHNEPRDLKLNSNHTKCGHSCRNVKNVSHCRGDTCSFERLWYRPRCGRYLHSRDWEQEEEEESDCNHLSGRRHDHRASSRGHCDRAGVDGHARLAFSAII